MIQLHILSGATAGGLKVIRRFPFHIGRTAENDLQLETAGVWDRHLTLEFQQAEGFLLHPAPDAFVAVNEEQKKSARLRNGDIISFGSAKIQFWLGAPRQHSLFLREASVWALLIAVTAFQFFLIYRLLK